MRSTFFAAVVSAVLPWCASQARAGASLFVDDATITPRGRCQVEAWARAYTPGRELTAVPACAWAETEIGLGVSRDTSAAHGAIVNLGIKHLLRDFDRHAWGAGAAFGVTWDGARDRLDGWNLNLPASVALDADRRTALHVNLGWNAPRRGPDALVAGLGVERSLSDRWYLLAEAYGDHRGGRGGQIGLRRSVGANASVDLLAGRQNDAPHARWLTLGLNVLLPN